MAERECRHCGQMYRGLACPCRRRVRALLAVPDVAGWDGACAGTWRTTTELYVRTAPALDAPEVGLWMPGELLFVWCQAGDWVLTQAADFRNGWTGWSNSGYLTPAKKVRKVGAPTAAMAAAAAAFVSGGSPSAGSGGGGDASCNHSDGAKRQSGSIAERAILTVFAQGNG